MRWLLDEEVMGAKQRGLAQVHRGLIAMLWETCGAGCGCLYAPSCSVTTSYSGNSTK